MIFLNEDNYNSDGDSVNSNDLENGQVEDINIEIGNADEENNEEVKSVESVI